MASRSGGRERRPVADLPRRHMKCDGAAAARAAPCHAGNAKFLTVSRRTDANQNPRQTSRPASTICRGRGGQNRPAAWGIRRASVAGWVADAAAGQVEGVARLDLRPARRHVAQATLERRRHRPRGSTALGAHRRRRGPRDPAGRCSPARARRAALDSVVGVAWSATGGILSLAATGDDPAAEPRGGAPGPPVQRGTVAAWPGLIWRQADPASRRPYAARRRSRLHARAARRHRTRRCRSRAALLPGRRRPAGRRRRAPPAFSEGASRPCSPRTWGPPATPCGARGRCSWWTWGRSTRPAQATEAARRRGASRGRMRGRAPVLGLESMASRCRSARATGSDPGSPTSAPMRRRRRVVADGLTLDDDRPRRR